MGGGEGVGEGGGGVRVRGARKLERWMTQGFEEREDGEGRRGRGGD